MNKEEIEEAKRVLLSFQNLAEDVELANAIITIIKVADKYDKLVEKIKEKQNEIREDYTKLTNDYIDWKYDKNVYLAEEKEIKKCIQHIDDLLEEVEE
jgi:superfamily II DNA or RNA helicase